MARESATGGVDFYGDDVPVDPRMCILYMYSMVYKMLYSNQSYLSTDIEDKWTVRIWAVNTPGCRKYILRNTTGCRKYILRKNGLLTAREE